MKQLLLNNLFVTSISDNSVYYTYIIRDTNFMYIYNGRDIKAT